MFNVRMKQMALFVLLILCVSLFFFSCGGTDGENPLETPEASTETPVPSGNLGELPEQDLSTPDYSAEPNASAGSSVTNTPVRSSAPTQSPVQTPLHTSTATSSQTPSPTPSQTPSPTPTATIKPPSFSGGIMLPPDYL